MLELPVARPLRQAPVKTLMLYLTLRCNLSCEYCFQAREPREMSTQTALRSLDFLLARATSGSERSVHLNFFGGEPFLKMDVMEEVIAYSRVPRPNCYKKVHFSATTNGTLASKRVERILKDAQMRLLISLDGGKQAMESRPFPGGRSAYEVIAKNIPRLISWSPGAVGRLTYRPGTLSHLKSNIEHLLDLGLAAIAVAPVQQESWKGHETQLQEVHLELAEWVIQEARQGRVVPLSITWELARLRYREQSSLPTASGCGGCRPGRPCQVGNELVSINPEGDLMPCHQFLYRPQDWLGTVAQPDLGEARRAYLELSAQAILGCDGCAARPVCAGGCRATALQYGQGLHGTHTGHCLVTRAHAHAVYHLYDTLMSENNLTFIQHLKQPVLPDGLTELALQN